MLSVAFPIRVPSSHKTSHIPSHKAPAVVLMMPHKLLISLNIGMLAVEKPKIESSRPHQLKRPGTFRFPGLLRLIRPPCRLGG